MVMDEVLTHLDASGRESVGYVCRYTTSFQITNFVFNFYDLLLSNNYVVRTVLRALVGSKINGKAFRSQTSDSGSIEEDSLKIIATNTQNGDEVLFQPSDDGTPNNQVADVSKLLMSGLGSNKLGGGAYETVLVILQDLSAMELEEAFDHVDIVCKTADTATVRVDGQMTSTSERKVSASSKDIFISNPVVNNILQNV